MPSSLTGATTATAAAASPANTTTTASFLSSTLSNLPSSSLSPPFSSTVAVSLSPPAGELLPTALSLLQHLISVNYTQTDIALLLSGHPPLSAVNTHAAAAVLPHLPAGSQHPSHPHPPNQPLNLPPSQQPNQPPNLPLLPSAPSLLPTSGPTPDVPGAIAPSPVTFVSFVGQPPFFLHSQTPHHLPSASLPLPPIVAQLPHTASVPPSAATGVSISSAAADFSAVGGATLSSLATALYSHNPSLYIHHNLYSDPSIFPSGGPKWYGERSRRGA